jgi:mono/diheme cytochrome c family protein
VPLDAAASGGAVALARRGERLVAYVADADSAAVHAIDVDAGLVLSTTSLAGAPARLLVTRDGRVVVALRDRALLEVLEPADEATAPLLSLCTVPVAAEPVALAPSPDGATLFVASRWGHALAALAADTLERRWEVSLPRDPSEILVAPDGASALVAHAVGGRVSAVDLRDATAPTVRDVPLGASRHVDAGACGQAFGGTVHPRTLDQSFALVAAPDGRVLVPAVLVDPVPIVDGFTASYGGRWWSQVPSATFAIVTLAREDRSPSIAPSPALGVGDCLLPRAAAWDAAGGSLLVACAGRDEVMVYDGQAPLRSARARRAVRVGAGPAGIAVDPGGRRAVVWSAFDGALDVLGLPLDPRAARRIPVAAHRALPPALDRGRRLFHDASSSRVAFDGRACASCHVDGRDDGITWTTKEGPRQTPMLLGRLADSAPYGWRGEDRTLRAHFGKILERFGGAGLSGPDLDAVFAWLGSLSPPAPGPGADEARRRRGEALFHADETGCSGCHAGSATTDQETHDVGTSARHDPGPFDTPSLRFVGQSAPYLHDGRYATLPALLEGLDGKMGSTKHLSADDRDALAAYVLSL